MPTQPLPFVVLVLVLYVLTTARLTRLVTTDKIGQPIRSWAVRRWPARPVPESWPEDAPRPQRWVPFLLHCAWCFGFWVALALVWPVLAVAGLPWWWFLGLVLACSYAVGWLASREGLG